MSLIEKKIQEILKVLEKTVNLSTDIEKAVNEITKCLKSDKKVIIFGNGGSAADSQHIAAEFIGRYLKERKSLPAISLTTDTSILTSLGNDYSFDMIFSRQCEGLVCNGDVVIGISTSGNSKNVLNGLKLSKEKNAKTIGLLGNNGGSIGKVVDIPIIVDSISTPRIQEMHRIVYHLICELVEDNMTK
jgi:D-sedoheptulose 7-phosphate isomerase